MNLNDDNAFWLELMTALHNLKGNEYVDAIAQLLSSMKQHQKKRWQEVLSNQKYNNGAPYRIKQEVYAAEVIKENNIDNTSALWRLNLGKQAIRDGQRVYDLNDPRLQHLAFIAEMTKEKGIDNTLVFLTANNFMVENSIVERFSKKFEDLKKGSSDNLLKAKYKILLGDEYDEIIKNNPDTDLKILKSALDLSVKKKEAQPRNDLIEARKNRVPQKHRIGLTVIISITTILLIAIAIIQYFK